MDPTEAPKTALEMLEIEIFDFNQLALGREELYKILGKIIEATIIVAIGLLVFFLLKIILKRYINNISSKKKGKTLAIVFDNLLKFITYYFVISQILYRVFNISIVSLLAVAGVGGIAIAFGAQSLVKDMIMGVFVLLEDEFGVSDIIRVGDKVGVVESLGLRTMRLRSINGEVHIIPNGELSVVTNLTKSFSRVLIDVGVPYEQNIDKMLKILSSEMADFSMPHGVVLKKPEVLGVQDFGPNSVIVRILCDCEAGEQWSIEREIRRKILLRLEKENIAIPYTQQDLHIYNNSDFSADTPIAMSDKKPNSYDV